MARKLNEKGDPKMRSKMTYLLSTMVLCLFAASLVAATVGTGNARWADDREISGVLGGQEPSPQQNYWCETHTYGCQTCSIGSAGFYHKCDNIYAHQSCTQGFTYQCLAGSYKNDCGKGFQCPDEECKSAECKDADCGRSETWCSTIGLPDPDPTIAQ
jgi:hypothetical protein